ncbi:uncharacterized protein LOC118767532 [Octopus sinensis]|uniref:Uncharacterized protein LOC118767532 n=1 Tax=Octopus sinensis TaxID=2607531 RepID=A0A7E6FK73_9MOLL|nr:uncharacterized protein LOC118767532 [Octopus sinensis]XP_036368127.1 uncharacterized protein LOC118767532 [Octopus sinensis]
MKFHTVLFLSLFMSTFYLLTAHDTAASSLLPSSSSPAAAAPAAAAAAALTASTPDINIIRLDTNQNASAPLVNDEPAVQAKPGIIKSLGNSIKSYLVRIRKAVFNHSLIIGPVVVTAFVVGVTVLTHRNRFS